MNNPLKFGVIGAGHVGATCAYYVAEKNIADIVLVDIVPGMPQAKGMDFCQAAPLRQYGVTVKGTNDFAEIVDSDVIVITAGVPRIDPLIRMPPETTRLLLSGSTMRFRLYQPCDPAMFRLPFCSVQLLPSSPLR